MLTATQIKRKNFEDQIQKLNDRQVKVKQKIDDEFDYRVVVGVMNCYVTMFKRDVINDMEELKERIELFSERIPEDLRDIESFTEFESKVRKAFYNSNRRDKRRWDRYKSLGKSELCLQHQIDRMNRSVR